MARARALGEGRVVVALTAAEADALWRLLHAADLSKWRSGPLLDPKVRQASSRVRACFRPQSSFERDRRLE